MTDSPGGSDRRVPDAGEPLNHLWARFQAIVGDDAAVDDPVVTAERLGILNTIIAASAGTESLGALLESVLAAICRRYPGLAGSVACVDTAVSPEVRVVAEDTPRPGSIDWAEFYADLPEWIAESGGGFAPRLLRRGDRVALELLVTPLDTLHYAIAFADVDNQVRIPNGALTAIALECNYVLDREVTTQRLRERETQFRAVFDASPMPQALMIGDHREFAVVNDALCRLLDLSQDELVGMSARAVTHPFDIPAIEKARALAGSDRGGQYRVPRRMVAADGRIIYTDTTLTWIHLAGGRRMLLQQITDVTAQRQAEWELIEQSETDSLTGIANRLHVVRLITEWGEVGTPFGVVFLDIDSFKSINDARGHEVGDEVLIEVATRLSGIVGPSDAVVRFGGDEFVIVCRATTHDEPSSVPGGAAAEGPSPVARAVRAMADAAQAALAWPIETSDGPTHITVSIGVCDDTIPVTRAIDRLQYADTAAYRAKRLGEDRQIVYDTGLHDETREYRRIESLLRAALADGRFVMHYQPIVDIADGRPLGVEALVRLRDEDDHLVPPGDFIAAAERSGLIVPMGSWVMAESCRQIAEINRQLGVDLHVSVNVAARQAARSDLADVVENALASAHLEPAALTLELTESALLDANDATLARLTELRERGVQIALDDFGTGYSSLTYLRKFPVTRIKVDRTFVEKMTVDPGNAAIVRAVTRLAADLGLAWVAEGVETAAQWEALRRLGPGLAQGFYFARPQPYAMLAHTLRDGLGKTARP